MIQRHAIAETPDDSLVNARQQPWGTLPPETVGLRRIAAARRAVMRALVILSRSAYTSHAELLHHRQHVDDSPSSANEAVLVALTPSRSTRSSAAVSAQRSVVASRTQPVP
jgi:hypothetical protein